MTGWIAVDLDGVLAEYHGWTHTFHIGPPIAKMVDRVKGWIDEGKDVRIFTARVDGGNVSKDDPNVSEEMIRSYSDVPAIRKLIEDWCVIHIGKILPVTNVKDYGMIELWDDRCVQVIPNTGERADGQP